MTTSTEPEYVTKIMYKDHDGVIRTVLALIVSENESFFEVKTRKNEFAINKAHVVSYSKTKQLFER